MNDMDDDYESKLRNSDDLPNSKDQAELLAEFERRRRVSCYLFANFTVLKVLVFLRPDKFMFRQMTMKLKQIYDNLQNQFVCY